MSEPSAGTEGLPDFAAERFPEDLYLMAFPDVREAVASGMILSGHEHYGLCGRSEIEAGLRLNPFTLVPGALNGFTGELAAPSQPIDPTRLRRRGGDRRRAGGAERRAAPQAAADEPASGPAMGAEDDPFDPAIYLAVNPDIARAIAAGQVVDARTHWRDAGQDEERRGLRPSILADEQFADASVDVTAPGAPADAAAPGAPSDDAGFDAEGYFFANPDVQSAIGHDAAAAAAHWRAHGRVEGRVRRGVAAFGQRRADGLAVLSRPFGLNVFGPFAAASGLGTAARNLVRALRAASLPFELFPFDVQTGAPRLPRDEAAHRPRYRINLILANADQVGPLIALYPPGTFDDAYTIGLWAWELAAFRPDWFECFGAVDEVWTNSDFELAAIAAVSPVPVTKIRLPVLVRAGDQAEARAAFGVPADRFVFFVAFDAGSTSARKNPRLALEAFREAFGPDDPVFLIVKFHSNNLEPQVTREVSLALRGAANVLVVAERVSEAEMTLLRACADCYVSPHRAEGYGLNIAEFMALGRPVIATGYSGNLEFLDDTTGYPVGYRLTEIESQAGPYRPYYVWAEPDRASLIAAMRQVVAEPAAAAARGAAGAARMAAEFSAARVGQTIARRLATLQLDQPSPAFLGQLGRTRGLRLPGLLAEHSDAERTQIGRLGERRVTFSVLLAASEAPDRVAAAIASVLTQQYPLWELVLVLDDAMPAELEPVLARLRGWDPRVRQRRVADRLGLRRSLTAAAEMATGEWVLLLPPGTMLAQTALLDLAAAMQPASGRPLPTALYADEHQVDGAGMVTGHHYRPDFSPELLEASAYAGGVLALTKAAFLQRAAEWQAGAPTGDASPGDAPPGEASASDASPDAVAYDLLLHLLRRRAAIGHVDAPLYQRPDGDGADTGALRQVLEAHIALAHGDAAHVEPGLLPGSFRWRRQAAAMPRVSLLLPEPATPDVLSELEALLPDAAARYDIVLIGDPAAFPRLPEGIRLIAESRTAGFAAHANLALRQARAEQVVLLGQGLRATTPDWLAALLEPLQDPDVGIVGGKLIGPGDVIVSAGLMLGPDGPMPLQAGQPAADSGYAGLGAMIRNVSTVSAGCLASRRSVLSELGGFDESLPAELAAADLCLRAGASAYRIVYTPFATLVGNRPAPAPESAEATARFLSRWSDPAGRERFYNRAFVPDGSFRLW